MSKLDELKEQFQGVIEGLKAKLNRGKKSKDDDEEDEDVSSEDKTGEVDVGESTETDVEASSEDSEDEDDDKTDPKAAAPDDKQKKKQLIIRGAIGLAVVYLAVDTMFLSEETPENAVPEVQEIKPKKPRKKKVKANPDDPTAQQQTESGNQAQPTDAPPTEQTPAQETAQIEQTPAQQQPVEQPQAEQTQAAQPPVEQPQADIPPETPTEVLTNNNSDMSSPTEPVPTEPVTPSDNTPPDSVTSEIPSIATDAPSQDSGNDFSVPDMGESTLPDTSSVPENSVGQTEEMNKEIDDLVNKVEEKKDSATTMKDKINVEVSKEYIAPPTYERTGRGLVYNCVGKHWACVDKLSYFQCRGNEVWNSKNGKNAECVIKNVYASDKDCSTIQSFYVSNNEPTNFCNPKGKTKTEVQQNELNLE